MGNACIIRFFYLPLSQKLKTTQKHNTMNRKMNAQQVRHFLLSFNDYTLIKWYNNVIVDAFGDYSEQSIRDNLVSVVEDLKNALSLETLINVARNPKTAYSEEDKFLALTGGEKPYFVSFSSFEEFLNVADGDDFCQYLTSQEDDLAALDEMANE